MSGYDTHRGVIALVTTEPIREGLSATFAVTMHDGDLKTAPSKVIEL